MRMVIRYAGPSKGEQQGHPIYERSIEHAHDIGVNPHTGLFQVFNVNKLPIFSTLAGNIVDIDYPDHDTAIQIVPTT